jgi:cell division septation protein DedD
VAKNDEGEFELILGNRQLLSVFFIVVILLGVFFTMGYIVGRNSAPIATEASTIRGVAPPVADSATRPAETPTLPADSSPVETAPQRPADTITPAPVAVKPAATRSEPSPEPKVESKKEKAAKAKAAAVASEPAAGQTYLQLAATSKHEADIMVDVLRNKGFKSMVAEIEEKPGTYRVLVGPIPDSGANKLRADLQASGFPGNAAIRRTF